MAGLDATPWGAAALVGTCVVVLAAIVAGGSWVLSEHPAIPGPQTATVESCTTIAQPGRYVLTADIADSEADTCLRIRSHDVTLLGGGHRIDGVGAFGSAGVLVRSNGSRPLENVTVRDVRVTDWDDGIRYIGVESGAVTGTVTANNRVGLTLLDARDVRLADNVARANQLHGISLLEATTNATLVNNTAIDNALFGFHLVEGGVRDTTLVSNTASGNEFGIGLIGVRENTVTRNTATENRIAGIWVVAASENRLSRNTVSNRFYGIFLSDLSSGNAVVENTADANAVGIRLRSSDRNTIADNTVEDSSDTAILLISSDQNEVVGNRGSGNNRGITIIGSSGNTVANNTVSG
jgi:parallel beta-helix repeat protein